MGSAPRVDFNANVNTSGNLFQTAVSAATATAGGVLSTGYNGAADLYNTAREEVQGQTGQETDAEKAARLQQEGIQAEQQARTDAYNSAVNDNSLDARTRQDLVRLYQSGASSTQIAAELAAAKAGKGIYGIRRINQNEININAKAPGRKQTVLSLGSGTVLG